jgi:putative FmdB family regulatory protein
MPTYEYRCVDCGNRIEVFLTIGAAPPAMCEVCGGALRKVFHPAGIVFKGSGFYATDSRSRSKPSREGDGKKEPAPGGSREPSKDAAKQGSGAGKKDGTTEAAS